MTHRDLQLRYKALLRGKVDPGSGTNGAAAQLERGLTFRNKGDGTFRGGQMSARGGGTLRGNGTAGTPKGATPKGAEVAGFLRTQTRTYAHVADVRHEAVGVTYDGRLGPAHHPLAPPFLPSL